MRWNAAGANQLRARSADQPPVYYGFEEASEDALQRVAGGARAAFAATGHMVEPIPFERQLADALRPTAAWSLRAEASRVPRPPTRPANLGWSEEPAPWRHAESGTWPPARVRALEGYHLFADVEVGRCGEAPYENWVQVAFMERHHTFPDRYTGTEGTQLLIAAGLELSDETAPTRDFPLAHTRPDSGRATVLRWSAGSPRPASARCSLPVACRLRRPCRSTRCWGCRTRLEASVCIRCCSGLGLNWLHCWTCDPRTRR